MVAGPQRCLPPEEKKDIQQSFIEGRLRVIAATNAFGMGIDKPDVGLMRFHRWIQLPYRSSSTGSTASRSRLRVGTIQRCASGQRSSSSIAIDLEK